MFYWANVWDNTIKLETIVREITTKACIISIIAHKDSKLTDKEKEDDIIEKAASICADVLLQHKIEPRDYDLQSLVQVEIFRINTSIKK